MQFRGVLFTRLRAVRTALASFGIFMVGALFAPLPNAVYSQDEPLVLVDESLDVDTTSFNNQVVPSYVNYEVTPDLAYRRLVAGNAKYLNEDSDAAKALPDLPNDAQRFPIASILYSSDMPTLPTTLTQTTTHDVYLTSIKAGAVASEHMTAIEYGLLNLQTPLLVVMGHYPSREVSNLIRNYDALKAQAQAESNKIARSGAQTVQSNAATPEQLKLYNLIGPAIARSKEAYPDLDGYNLANVVSEALVWQSLETILMKSTVAQDLIRAGKLNVIAAIVDDQTGKIYWLGAHPLQEEFLKPTPENLQTVEDSNTILTESELPEALDDSTIQSYVQAYENDVYYNEIVNEYYTQPYYYEPSWELFSQRAWVYRPWYGVWVTPFTPWPYWQPWGAPTPGGASVGLSIWDGRLNFYIGYNRHYDRLIYYDPDYRPLDPWWGADYFRRPAPHPHDPIFDLIISGRRHDIRHEPFDAPWRRPGLPAPAAPAPGYHPGVARPGIVISLGGIQIGVPLTDHNRDRYRPGGSAPNPGMRTPGSQPGGAPMSIPGRADRGAIVNPRQPIGARPNPGVTPGARPNPGVQPGSGARPNPGVTPGARPNPGVQPGSGARSTPGASPTAPVSAPSPATRPTPGSAGSVGAPSGARPAPGRHASTDPTRGATPTAEFAHGNNNRTTPQAPAARAESPSPIVATTKPTTLSNPGARAPGRPVTQTALRPALNPDARPNRNARETVAPLASRPATQTSAPNPTVARPVTEPSTPRHNSNATRPARASRADVTPGAPSAPATSSTHNPQPATGNANNPPRPHNN